MTLAFPVCHEGNLKGVIELASVTEYSASKLEFLTAAEESIGIAINTAQIHKKMQELFEETQAQTEELQSQHSELENLNTELESQTQKIQASEEELRVQQEELMQSNQELEERSRLLEEKNQLIVERNIEIQQKARQLELSTRYKSEFLANMSHELRTPLNSILLLSRFMAEKGNLDKELVEYAQVIQSSGEGLLSLIDEILDLSKIEAGKMNMKYADVSLKDIAANLKALFDPVARDKELEFKISIADNVPQQIHTDQMRLEQILKNLISNALKFTSKGSIRLSVSLSPVNPNFVLMAVKDSGIGIAEDKKQLIFDAFQQADGSTRRKFGGTGLGLSISRELSNLLGGTIRLNSKLGKGREFVLTIPVKNISYRSGTNRSRNRQNNITHLT